jgi:hypothetical protein
MVSEAHHWPVNDGGALDHRGAAPSRDSEFASRQEVTDTRTPLSVLLYGEQHERVATNRAIDAAVGRILRLVDELVELPPATMDEMKELIGDAIGDEIQQARVNTVRGMLRYFWHGGLNPWEAMKRMLATTREVACHLIGGVTQTEVALILDETKAATSAREGQLEALLKKWGVRGFRLVGGKKTDEAKAIYRQVQQGNKSREKGERRKRAEALRGGGGAGADGIGPTGPR